MPAAQVVARAMTSRTVRFNWQQVLFGLGEMVISLPEGSKVYGVPRAGQILAGLLASRGMVPTEDPDEADAIVDDIIDSGRTLSNWVERYPSKPFLALVDKRDMIGSDPRPYIVFPWEYPDQHVKDGQQAVVRLLEALGEDPNREGLRDTPRRVFKAYQELTEGIDLDAGEILSTVFDEKHDQMIVVRNVGFWSLCEHHLLPFSGDATVAYVPRGKVVGLSKIARLVRCFAARLQIQERMTEQIAEELQRHLDPLGVGVVIRANHTCMAMRGIRATGEMLTSALRGVFMQPEVRAEFLGLAGR